MQHEHASAGAWHAQHRELEEGAAAVGGERGEQQQALRAAGSSGTQQCAEQCAAAELCIV